MFHLGGSVRGRRHATGTVSGLALYPPLAVSAYWAFARAGLLTATTFAVSFTAGLLYHAIPVGYMPVVSLVRGDHFFARPSSSAL